MKWTPSQQQALQSQTHTLIEAGAGSGKTSVMVQRYVDALMHGEWTSLDQLVAITFTNYAAAELKSRIQAHILSPDNPCPSELQHTILTELPTAPITTIHGFCYQLLKKYRQYSDLDPDFHVVSAEDAVFLFNQSIPATMHQLADQGHSDLAFYLQHSSMPRLSMDLQHLYYKRLQLDSAIKTLDKSADRRSHSVAMTQALLSIFDEVMMVYQHDLRQSMGIDFDDVLSLTHQLLDQPHVQQSLSSHIRLMMVDEFQDTDSLQWSIIQKMSQFVASSPPTHSTLFLVGDIKQSIYSFRGSDPRLFMTVFNQLQEAGTGQVVHMADNFRSQSAIISFINPLFDALFQQDSSAELAIPYTPLTAQRSDTDGSVHFLSCSDEESQISECRNIMAWILDRRAADPALNWSDMAILCRNRQGFSALKMAADQAGIPLQIQADTGFFQQEHIQDLLSIVTLLIQPNHELSWVRLLQSPLMGATLADIHDCIQRKKTQSWSEFLSTDTLIRSQCPQLKLWLPIIKKSPYCMLRDMLWESIQQLNWLINYPAIDTLSADLTLVIGLVDELDQSHRLSRYDIIQRLHDKIHNNDTIGRATGDVDDAVQLMTIHYSKGLEFPVVVVPFCHKPIYWSSSDTVLIHPQGIGLALANSDEASTAYRKSILAHIRQDTIEEEKRLFYVALTRAKNHLACSFQHPDTLSKIAPSFLSFLLDSAAVGSSKISFFNGSQTYPIQYFDQSDLHSFSPSQDADSSELSHDQPPAFVPEPIIQRPSYPSISVTELEDAMTCIKQYVHRQFRSALAQFNTLEHPDTDIGGDEFGEWIHRLLYLVHCDPPAWSSTLEGAPLSMDHKHRLRHMVTRYLESDLYSQICQAQNSTHQCMFEKRVQMICSSRLINGRLDGAFFNGDDWVIYDYKTQVSDTQRSRYQRQMSIYALLLSNGVAPWSSGVIQLHLYDCTTGQSTIERLTGNQQQDILDQMTSTLASIDSKTFTPPSESQCHQCDIWRVQSTCPQRDLFDIDDSL